MVVLISLKLYFTTFPAQKLLFLKVALEGRRLIANECHMTIRGRDGLQCGEGDGWGSKISFHLVTGSQPSLALPVIHSSSYQPKALYHHLH